MGAKFEVWRAADQAAHEAEMHIRHLGRRDGNLAPSYEEVERVRALRRVADQLFDEAMVELSSEVGAAIKMAGGVCEFRPVG